MSDSCCRIERQSNGFTVDIRDPEIEAANNKRDGSRTAPIGRWRDPWKSYVFKDVGEVLAFLKKALPKAAKGDEYGSAFDAAVAIPDGD